MKLTTKVTMDAEKWHALKKLQGALAETALRQRGVIFANALRTVTPPHGKGATMASTAKKDNDGIRALRKRIAQDIAGVDDVEQISAYADPVLTRSGKWIALQTGTKKLALSKGNFGFIVLSSTSYRGKRVPLAKPAEVYGKPVFKRGRAHVSGVWAPVFVKAAALRAFVKQKQAHAGKFVSGWVHGYLAFGGKSVPAGYFRKLGGAGYGRKQGSGEKLRGVMGNEAAPDAAMATRAAMREKRALRIAEPALRTNARALAKWYKKKMKELLK